MKKVVTLVLVLSMVSMASAALTWSVASVDLNPGESIDVYLVSDSSDLGSWYNAPADMAVADITAATMEAAIDTGDSSVTLYGGAHSYAGWVYGYVADFSPPSDVVAGNWSKITITAEAGAVAGQSTTVTSDYYGSNGAATDLVVNIIPEPATMALLGLGGLLLRRKK